MQVLPEILSGMAISLPSTEDVNQVIQSNPQVRWMLTTLGLNTKNNPIVAPARLYTLKLLRRLLEYDIQSILSHTTPDAALIYPDIWESIFAHLAITDAVAFRWLISIIRPVFRTRAAPKLLLGRIGEHVREIALTLAFPSLISLIEDSDEGDDGERTRTAMISMLFTPNVDVSNAAEVFFYLTYDEVLPSKTVPQRWPADLARVSVEIIDSLGTLADVEFYRRSLDRLFEYVAACNDESVASAACSLALRLVEANHFTPTIATIIPAILCFLEKSGCEQIARGMDATLRETYLAEPPRPGKQLLGKLDTHLGHALLRVDPTLYTELLFDLPKFMRQEHSRGMDTIRKEQEAIAHENAQKVMAGMMARLQPKPSPPPNDFPFGPRALRRVFKGTLILASGHALHPPPEILSGANLTMSQRFRNYEYHIAVECFHSLPQDLADPELERYSTFVDGPVEYHEHEPDWARLKLKGSRGSNSMIVHIAIASKQSCYAMMRKEERTGDQGWLVTLCIPRHMGEQFQHSPVVYITVVAQ